jgi:AcrR family transcriptional regulator
VKKQLVKAGKSSKRPRPNEDSQRARRVPLQARSKERVDRMIDSAEQEFAEVGYESATTESIADRAGTSIGSLYQFFPHKRALFDAVAERYQSRAAAFFHSEVEKRLAATFTASNHPAAPNNWVVMIDAMIDAYWEFVRASVGFRAVWLNGHLSRELLDSEMKFGNEAAGRVAEICGLFAPQLPSSRRLILATMLIEIAGMMLFIASRRKEPLASALIEETKSLLKDYATRFLTEHPVESAREKRRRKA